MSIVSIPLISSRKGVKEKILNALSSFGYSTIEIPLILDCKSGIEYLNVYLPDLFILDISDGDINPFGFMDEVMKDSWLLHAGIIAIVSENSDIKKLEEYSGANILIILNYEDIERQLHKVIGIVEANANILVQRAIGVDFIGNISGSFIMNNDVIEVACYTNLICNFLYNTNRIVASEKTKLNITIYELLLNAVEHGNCGITYDEKSEWLESCKNITDLIDARNSIEEIKNRKVLFEFKIESDYSNFFIGDEGDGFDWRNVRDNSLKENIFKLHGRGILMARNFTRDLIFNEKGNEVSFKLNHSKENTRLAPSIFKGVNTLYFKNEDVVFCQEDNSDTLYYIVKGVFKVIANGIEVARLTPNDIFLGEMSFLLNNRRSATIIASGDCILMPISRTEFVHAIKKSPHYALYLSRILAQRLDRLNEKVYKV